MRLIQTTDVPSPKFKHNPTKSFLSHLLVKFTTFSLLLFTVFCFLKAGAGFFSQDNPASLPTAQAALRAPTTNKRLITTPIQKLQPGMRVLGRNPDRFDTQLAIEPNPISWRLVSVRMEHKPGEYVLGKLLRPTSWIRGNQAQPGAVISLEIPEMNVAGAAEVLSIEACPPIKDGPGSVVTGTFEHVSDNVISVFVKGEEKPIGTTAKHPFWSKDRAAFVPAGELRIGEELKTALGTSTRVTSIEIRAGPETVYGLEVAGEHVYQIANAGLLVHNASGRRALDATVDINAPRSINSWNEFQSVTKGQFKSRKEAATAWRVYKESRDASKTLVIGRLPDTASAELAGFQRLNTNNWSPAVNDAWVQGAIDAQKPIKLVSPIKKTTLRNEPGSLYPDTIFRRELHQLKKAGYRIENGWALPSGT